MNMKEYPISDDLALLNDKHLAAKKIRGLAIKLPFGYKKAFRAATDSERFRRLFWSRVRGIYPELQNKNLAYDNQKQIVWVSEEKEDQEPS
jgi:hypothetical protein